MTQGVLLIGLGAIGMGYDLDPPSTASVRTHARAFARLGELGQVMAVDTSVDRRRLFSETYGTPCYASMTEALANLAPSVVVVATPTPTHAQILHEVLERTAPLAILCEKPLAADPRTAESMVADCERRRVPLYVNYMRRADPGAIAVRQMILSGELHAPIKGIVWYSKGLVHNGSHFVDLLRFWFGDVHASSIVRTGRRWEDRDPEPDFTLSFRDATVAFIAASEECFSHYTVELVCGNGRLRYERGGERIEWQGVIDDPDCAGYRVLEPDPRLLDTDMARSQLNVVRQLVRALQGQSSTLCSGAEALETLRDIYHVIDLL